jgi:CHAD domain-containing protein
LNGEKNEIVPFLNKVTEKRAHHFLKTNARKLNEILERGIFKERDLHKIRKKLKSFYFIAKITNENMTIPEPWNKLLELLGKWHDEQVAVEHLRKATYSSRFSQDEVNRLYVVKREITDNRENLFDQIVATYFLIESKEGSLIVPDYFELV